MTRSLLPSGEMQSLVAYTYSPLDFSDSIRLLLLEPANNKKERLRGTLVTRTLSSIQNDLQTSYTALSYVWGDPTRTEALELIDENKLCSFQLGLTTNLHSALTDIRDASRAILMWADAICIDQNNLDERGHQVGLMGNIYRGAGCTIIYLGPSTRHVKYAFEAIQRNFGTSAKRSALPQKVTAQEADLNLNVDVLDHAIETICSRDWFKRGWVFQELVLSNNPRIQCGKYRVGWSHLHTMIQHLQCSGTSVSRFLSMDKTRNDDAARTFSQLVISRKGAQLSDPRDFFFCLMGIASDAKEVQKRLPVDYSLSVRHVFIQAAEYMVQTIGLSSVIKHVSSDTGYCGLPSFVPAWGVSEVRTMSALKDSLPARSLWGERNVVRDCWFMSVCKWQFNHVAALDDTIPRNIEFVDALQESLELLANNSRPGAGSPLYGLWNHWSSRTQRRMWTQFCHAILGLHFQARTIALDFEGKDRPFNFITDSAEDQFKDMKYMIRLVKQNLSFPVSEDLPRPESRLALCNGLIAIVPADTVLGDMVVELGSFRNQDHYTDPRYLWYVVRPANRKLLDGEEFKLLKSAKQRADSWVWDLSIVEIRGVAQVVTYTARDESCIAEEFLNIYMVLV